MSSSSHHRDSYQRDGHHPESLPPEVPVDPEARLDDGYFDDPRRIAWIVRGLIIACVLLTVADLFYDKHAKYDFEDLFGFFGFYGFISCVGLVLAASALRRVLMRDEDYYTRREESSSWILGFAHPARWRPAEPVVEENDDSGTSLEGPEDPQDATRERAW
ncbi:MAG: hypothetical protein AAGD01_06030 [Acidobacteriota bacterium]